MQPSLAEELGGNWVLMRHSLKPLHLNPPVGVESLEEQRGKECEMVASTPAAYKSQGVFQRCANAVTCQQEDLHEKIKENSYQLYTLKDCMLAYL